MAVTQRNIGLIIVVVDNTTHGDIAATHIGAGEQVGSDRVEIKGRSGLVNSCRIPGAPVALLIVGVAGT